MRVGSERRDVPGAPWLALAVIAVVLSGCWFEESLPNAWF